MLLRREPALGEGLAPPVRDPVTVGVRGAHQARVYLNGLVGYVHASIIPHRPGRDQTWPPVPARNGGERSCPRIGPDEDGRAGPGKG
ncbi:hypothetical protein GCM10023195_68450 [Actinoallomurus liliacearum]|uniref:SH3 domain-containing protein n=1 Tax=Actinoallomurus liliacearum TaxID=1080073 RepID=A0ABP8TVX9_9ACTN